MAALVAVVSVSVGHEAPVIRERLAYEKPECGPAIMAERISIYHPAVMKKASCLGRNIGGLVIIQLCLSIEQLDEEIRTITTL